MRFPGSDVHRALVRFSLAISIVATVIVLLPSASPALAEDVAPLVTRDVVYGDPKKPDSELQSLDIYWKDNAKKRAVIIYVHDGGWAFGDKSDVHLKPNFFALHDIAFVSMNYRLRWDYGLADQAADIASVVKWVRGNAKQYGLDPSRVILMGHGAGAHLVSLVGTDAQYLKAKGLTLADIRSVVAIDTISFDIPALMASDASFVEKRRHRLIFGEDEAILRAASPITYVAKGKQIPPFALLYVNGSSAQQSREFSRALREADVNVIMIPGNDKTSQSIDEELGRPGDAPTLALIAFIRATI
ncbi:MAG: alpha/beta hydrolase [Pseudomonadales bacterium]|nr:alpha/beta hydrolase [Pseudomonadales bacterium]